MGLVVLGLAMTAARAAGPATGFQADRRVRESTRLDWEFAGGRGAQLPAAYDSRRLRYQLFVPPTYRASEAWPLVVFVPPGDAPLGWRAWQKPCEQGGFLYASAFGAGNDCPLGQRMRSLCDLLDDIRREYRIDPDRTYLAGFGGGAETAFRLATALPELFGGVILMGGDGPLPALPHLRARLEDRLSVALVCGAADRTRPQMEQYRLPLLTGLGVRARFWVVPGLGHALPPSSTLAEVLRWLDEDRKRRQADSREQGTTVDETPSRTVLAGRAVARAREQLRKPDQLYRTAMLLEWAQARCGSTEAARQAKEMLDELRKGPQRKLLSEQADTTSRRLLLARAAALEKAGRLAEARRAWEGVGRLADTDALRQRAAKEARRLAARWAETPYLGLTLEGDTTTVRSVVPGGPAHRAGLRGGDRVEQMGEEKVSGPADVRRRLARCKPRDELRLGVRRTDQSLVVAVTVGSPPDE
jgi:predicted esterase